jgi:hypothetical protein
MNKGRRVNVRAGLCQRLAGVGPTSFQLPKVLKSPEDAHLKAMSLAAWKSRSDNARETLRNAILVGYSDKLLQKITIFFDVLSTKRQPVSAPPVAVLQRLDASGL